MGAIEYRKIDFGSEDYHAALELRDRVLRRPLQFSILNDPLEKEIADIHIAAFAQDSLVAVLILTPQQCKTILMRQVAVDPAWQGRGVGRKLVTFAEKTALDAGYSVITLHARKTALQFYLKCGYRVIGEEFTEVGIPHVGMKKALV